MFLWWYTHCQVDRSVDMCGCVSVPVYPSHPVSWCHRGGWFHLWLPSPSLHPCVCWPGCRFGSLAEPVLWWARWPKLEKQDRTNPVCWKDQTEEKLDCWDWDKAGNSEWGWLLNIRTFISSRYIGGERGAFTDWRSSAAEAIKLPCMQSRFRSMRSSKGMR